MMKDFLPTVLKGAAMGVAEVIPGVSGGTIAFITGIYERLIDAIKSFSPTKLLAAFKADGIAGVWKSIDGTFLVSLLIGMVGGIGIGVTVVKYLLETHPVYVWSFFFGLIVASAVYIAKQITKWSALEIILLIIGSIFAYWITIATPSTGSESLWFTFLAGSIAICALILPGISGSFILLLMGMYTFILHDTLSDGVLKQQDSAAIIRLLVFGAGCLIGLLCFSNFVSWTFKHYKNPTLALLTGFMIGSLNKIWPWRNVLEWRVSSSGEKKPFLEESILPEAFDSTVLLALICAIVGFGLVFGLEKLDKKETH